jgi:antitoxin component of MazEF toxin-antitoxin module
MRELFRLKIASKRQVTMPQRLLNVLNLAEGDEIRVTTENGSIVGCEPFKMIPASLFTPEILSQLSKREAEMATSARTPVNPAELIQEAEAKANTQEPVAQFLTAR